MLKRLVIKNFAIIEDISIDFDLGMNCIIGETGAGKSIIIDALSLLKGEKSLFDKIRNNETKAYIEGEFIIDNELVKEQINSEFGDLIEEDNLLIVSRTLDINSKSTVRINMHSSNISSLKRIMELVIDIHSQHKDNSYFDDNKQIHFLDSFIIKSKNDAFSKIKEEYDSKYQNYLLEVKKLEEYNDKKDHFEDLDYLEYQFNEIDKLDIKENEIEEIEQELKSLESFESLADKFAEFDSNYNEASGLLYNAKKSLSLIKDEQFLPLIEKFNDLYYQIDESHEEISSKFNLLSENLSKLDYLRNRRSQLSSLRRKYGKSTKDILDAFNDIKEQIDLITNFDYVINEQIKKIESSKNEVISLGNQLSNIRKDNISVLEKMINNELHDLLLENAQFKIELSNIEPNSNGVDNILFTIRTNIGGKFLSLSSTASLGETSRINLAIKNVFNKLNPVGTIIFDEIDTGISGKAASVTAIKVKEISKSSQTIVISHLPQMAAKGDNHYFVKKIVEDNTTKTKVKKLNNEEVLIEISKMMSGSSTKESLELAKSLINE